MFRIIVEHVYVSCSNTGDVWLMCIFYSSVFEVVLHINTWRTGRLLEI